MTDKMPLEGTLRSNSETGRLDIYVDGKWQDMHITQSEYDIIRYSNYKDFEEFINKKLEIFNND